MKIKECRSCPHFQLARYHSGYTGKSGPETWNWCEKKAEFLRHIKNCAIAATKEK